MALLVGAVSVAAVGLGANPQAPVPPTVRTAVVPAAAGSALSPATGGPGRRPGDVINLANWYLTLPTGRSGDPDTVEGPRLTSYASDNFRLNDRRDGVVFSAAAGGATTKNSEFPRSELREMNGAAKASWSNASGTHTLTARQAITALPRTKPEVVSAQIHDTVDDVMQVRLDGSQLMVQYDDGRGRVVMDPSYRLGTVFEVRIVAAQRQVFVFYNGVLKAQIHRSGSGWYFKSGSYVQSNTRDGDAPTATGSVVIYALDVTHSG